MCSQCTLVNWIGSLICHACGTTYESYPVPCASHQRRSSVLPAPRAVQWFGHTRDGLNR